MTQEQIKFEGQVTCKVRDEDGNIKDERTIKNIVVAGMLDNVVSSFNAESFNPNSGFYWIGLGKGDTPETVTDTDLDDEFDITAFGGNYSSRPGPYNEVDLAADTYTVTGALENDGSSTESISEASLFNMSQPLSGDLGCRTAFTSSIDVDPGEQIEFQWEWQVSSA